VGEVDAGRYDSQLQVRRAASTDVVDAAQRTEPEHRRSPMVSIPRQADLPLVDWRRR